MNDNLLRKWALVAEILGGAAVVLSLIFVGFQIRQSSLQTEQNTVALEVSAYQNLVALMNDMNMEMYRDEYLASLNFRFGRDEITSDDPDYPRLVFYIGYVTRLSDMAYLQYERGLISETQLVSTYGPLKQVLRSDIGLERWSRLKVNRNLSLSFMNYVEENILNE